MYRGPRARALRSARVASSRARVRRRDAEEARASDFIRDLERAKWTVCGCVEVYVREDSAKCVDKEISTVSMDLSSDNYGER